MNDTPNRSRRAVLALLLGLAALVLLLIASLAVGPGEVGIGEALRAVMQGLAGTPSPEAPRRAHQVHNLVFTLRLPRALLAALLGAALGAAGALTQGLFRNPLAEPGVLGIGTGGALMASIGILIGVDRLGLWISPLLAALGCAAVLLLLFALVGARASSATLLLAGVALGALTGAGITIVLALAGDRWDLGQRVLTWLMGSLEARGWAHLGAAFAPILAGLGLAFWLRRDLDVLHLGETTACSLGVDLRRTRALGVTAVALLVGTATALAGVIGFVGLVVPHAVRMLSGPGHRSLLPGSMVGGAALVLVVDLLVRGPGGSVFPPGAITSLLGAPFFLWLLLSRGTEGVEA